LSVNIHIIIPLCGGIKRWSASDVWRRSDGVCRVHPPAGWEGAYWFIGPGSAGLAQGCRCELPLQRRGILWRPPTQLVTLWPIFRKSLQIRSSSPKVSLPSKKNLSDISQASRHPSNIAQALKGWNPTAT